jgi:mono/diheme cytochrome c family protein
MNRKIFLATFIWLGLIGSLAAATEDAGPSSERGQQTFMRVGCYQCHGSDGYGNGAGPALTPNTLPPQTIATIIRFNAGRMPVYPKEVLSDDEIADIVAFLKTVPKPPPADSIDILKDLKRSN